MSIIPNLQLCKKEKLGQTGEMTDKNMNPSFVELRQDILCFIREGKRNHYSSYNQL